MDEQNKTPIVTPLQENLVKEAAITNPLASIWFKPRATIRHIVDSNPKQYFIPLGYIAGVYRGLDNMSNRSMGDSWETLTEIIMLALGLGFFGILGFYFSAFMLRVAGNLLGGKATSEQTRAAVAWSSIPNVFLLIFTVFMIVIFGHDYFTSELNGFEANLLNNIFVVASAIILGIVALIWKIVLNVICLAEVHQFSIWKSMGTHVLAFLIIGLPIVVMLFIFGGI